MVGGRIRGHFRKCFLPSGQPQFGLWLLGATVVSVLEGQDIPFSAERWLSGLQECFSNSREVPAKPLRLDCSWLPQGQTVALGL